VVFLDGHCSIPRRDYLKRMVELFEATGAACLCRPQPLDRIIDGPWPAAIAAARQSRFGHNPGSDIYSHRPGFTDPRSAGAAYLRTCLEELGGYDERFDACEDVEFNHRVAQAGCPAYRHPDLAVAYRVRGDLRALYRQMVRYGQGRAHLLIRHPRVLPWPLLLATVLIIGAPAVPVFFGAQGAALVAAPIVCWTVPAAAEAFRLGRRPRPALRIVLAFLIIHAGLVLGFWHGLLHSRRFLGSMPVAAGGVRSAAGSRQAG
jgi:hypothetical protein